MKNKIVWILKLQTENMLVGIGFLKRNLVWYAHDKIEQISLKDSLAKFWMIKTLARDWNCVILSDDAGFNIWLQELGFAFPKDEPFVIEEEEAKMRGSYLNPRAKRKIDKFLEPNQEMFRQN